MCRAQRQNTRRGDNLALTVWTGAGAGVGEGSCCFHGTAAAAEAQATDRIAGGEVGGGRGVSRKGRAGRQQRAGARGRAPPRGTPGGGVPGREKLAKPGEGELRVPG